ncbi:hypothetical protein [Rathayibacter soli]|uniref:hypothetical protein n=1 Tax=Rathayibacter soli TaxID=3144168 RepID=UPI0027E3EF33|nr:hypothetical protein [Glaciibacter superstes]
MKVNEIVRRTLADAALRGDRRWANLADIAHASKCSVASAHVATRHLVQIGAMQTYGRGGLSVLDPERVTTVLAVERNLRRDTLTTTTRAGAEALIAGLEIYALGGTTAAVHYLGGRNTVADLGQRLVYAPAEEDLSELPTGDDVRVVSMDAVARSDWRDGYSSLAQTYADLFAQPGWQASEFRRALWRKLFDIDDWSRAEQDIA